MAALVENHLTRNIEAVSGRRAKRVCFPGLEENATQTPTMETQGEIVAVELRFREVEKHFNDAYGLYVEVVGRVSRIKRDWQDRDARHS